METGKNQNSSQILKVEPAVNEAKQELQNLNNGLQSQPGFEEKRKEIILRHVTDLNESTKNWFDRWMLKKEDKDLLRLYAQKEQEAAEIIMTNQNRALKAICKSQAEFVEEVCRTLLLTGQSGMKLGANSIFRENELTFYSKMMDLNNKFSDMVEVEFNDAGQRPQITQTMKLDQINGMMGKWKTGFDKLLDDFSSILDKNLN